MRITSLPILVVSMLAAGLAACGAEPFSGVVDAAPGPEDVPIPVVDARDIAPEDAPEDVPPPQLLALGATCAMGTECDSGFCTDGVCCQEICNGTCVSCALAGKKGTCSPHPLASDPDSECTDQPITTCGLDGFCDGAGACHKYAKGTECGAAECTPASFIARAECDGLGVCQKPAATTCQKFTCASTIACRIICSSNDHCVDPNACLAGVCGGITGRYYNGVNNFAGTPALRRVDPNINFDWGTGNPGNNVNADLFSVRWTGTLTPRFTETYTFYIGSSDGNRMSLDGVMVVNGYTDHVATPEITGTRDLVAGKAYAIVVDYYERYTDALIKLSWSSPSEPKAVIPTSAFSP